MIDEMSRQYQLDSNLTIRQLEVFMRDYGTTDLADIGGQGMEDRLAIFGWIPDVYDMGIDGFDICKTSLPKKYKTVICCNTFEHILEPKDAAKNIVASLKKGGYLFLTTVFLYPFHPYEDVIDTYRYTTTALSYLFQELEEVKCWFEDETQGGYIRVSYIGRKK